MADVVNHPAVKKKLVLYMASAHRANVIALFLKRERTLPESNNIELNVRMPLSFHAITCGEGHHRHYDSEREF